MSGATAWEIRQLAKEFNNDFANPNKLYDKSDYHRMIISEALECLATKREADRAGEKGE